jgi:hypothetical protein
MIVLLALLVVMWLIVVWLVVLGLLGFAVYCFAAVLWRVLWAVVAFLTRLVDAFVYGPERERP